MAIIIPSSQGLKYGTIYIYSDPDSMTLLRGSADFLRKIVHPMNIEWVDDPGRLGALLTARRFNVGNIGRYATVSLRTSQHNRGGGQMRALHEFIDALMSVSDPESGDIEIDEDDYGWGGLASVCYEEAAYDADISMPSAAPQDKTRVEKSRPRRHILRGFKKRLKDVASEAFDEFFLRDEDEMDVKEAQQSTVRYHAEQSIVTDKLQEEEDIEFKRLEKERQAALERIKHEIVSYIARFHDDPKDLMARLLQGKVVVGQPGRVLVNGDLKIVLPEYDEMEIKMPALCRTLYILFLKHRSLGGDGIVLKNIDEHRDEIFEIYCMVKPGADEQLVERRVNNLCDPSSDSLNQTISKINRCIRNVITDKELAADYCITGDRGQLYGIALDPQYLELPRAVTGA